MKKLLYKILLFMKAILDILHKWCNTLHHKYQTGIYTFVATEDSFVISSNFHYQQIGIEPVVPDNVHIEWQNSDDEFIADWIEEPNQEMIIGSDDPVKIGSTVRVIYQNVISITINEVRVVG